MGEGRDGGRLRPTLDDLREENERLRVENATLRALVIDAMRSEEGISTALVRRSAGEEARAAGAVVPGLDGEEDSLEGRRDWWLQGVVRGMTAKQHAVVQGLMLGLPNKTMAERMRIGESTVKVHVRTVCQKLGVSKRGAAVALLAKWFEEVEPGRYRKLVGVAKDWIETGWLEDGNESWLIWPDRNEGGV